jgi:hypothetical protein
MDITSNGSMISTMKIFFPSSSKIIPSFKKTTMEKQTTWNSRKVNHQVRLIVRLQLGHRQQILRLDLSKQIHLKLDLRRGFLHLEVIQPAHPGSTRRVLLADLIQNSNGLDYPSSIITYRLMLRPKHLRNNITN